MTRLRLVGAELEILEDILEFKQGEFCLLHLPVKPDQSKHYNIISFPFPLPPLHKIKYQLKIVMNFALRNIYLFVGKNRMNIWDSQSTIRKMSMDTHLKLDLIPQGNCDGIVNLEI